MKRFLGASVFVAVWLSSATQAPPFEALAGMPVREITVFKDGHALVLHRGSMPTDPSGDVVMDYLPSPVIGAFWPFSSDAAAKLTAVTAGRRKVQVDRTALNLRELIEANVGVKVVVTENALSYEATILDVPARSGDEEEAMGPPHAGERLTQKGSVVLLQTATGVKVVLIDRVQDIRFTGDYRKTVPVEEFRNLLTLKLDWSGGEPQPEADVGLLYLQRGIRWIPNYKVSIDGKGKASVMLQATLVNELADLDNVTANLVIGVPTFEFAGTPDPMSLQQHVAQLSQYFQQDAQTAYAFANAIMTQQAMSTPANRRAAASESGSAMDLGPEVADSARNEDLFVFTVKHISLKKGQRMVMPIAEFALEYQDVFALDIPCMPPPEVWRNLGGDRQSELARLFAAPKVMHKIRLFNDSDYPLTTAPALILREGRVLAQGLMTYASPGSHTDLNITTAVDIRVRKTDNETGRTPNAVVWQGDSYGRIDLQGKITLTSFHTKTIEVEVVRNVLGNVDSAGSGGRTEMVNILEDPSFAAGPGATAHWWGRFSWPWWWHHFNGVGRITWTVRLEPKEPRDLEYTWNYYWR